MGAGLRARTGWTLPAASETEESLFRADSNLHHPEPTEALPDLMRWWRPDGLSFGIAVAIGLAISTGYPAGFVAAMAMPVACLIPKSRKAAFRNAVGYYSAGLWPMIPGAQRYLGQSSSLLVAPFIWLCSSILLSLP